MFEMEADNLAEAIADLDRQERILTLELMDVLTDIATPDSSDVEVEDEEVEELELPQVRDACSYCNCFSAYFDVTVG